MQDLDRVESEDEMEKTLRNALEASQAAYAAAQGEDRPAALKKLKAALAAFTDYTMKSMCCRAS